MKKTCLLLMLLYIGMMIIPVTLQAKRVKPNSVYIINLKNTLIEYKPLKTPHKSFFEKMLSFNSQKSTGLNQLLRNIEAAKNNPNIEGIYLEGGSLSAGVAQLEELRNALLDFKKTGKFIYAYADNYSQSNYYLASVANKIFLYPYGNVNLKGLSISIPYIKKTLDTLGIKMEVIKVGTYKSAPEPYSSDTMSMANREQLTSMLNSVWTTIKNDIANSRNINIQTIDSMANVYAALSPSADLVKADFIDSTVYKDDVDTILKKLSPKAPFKMLSNETFTKINRKIDKNKNKIAVIYANGEIGGKRGGIYDEEMERICNKLAGNKAVKAVVLRVNSPGGSAFQSEKIWRALTKLKAKKPLIVSMANYAASGGYYISSLADSIFAEPTTITGSIGIFGQFPILSGLYNKLGINYESVKTNTMSDAYTLNRPLTPEERVKIQDNVNRGYALFVKRCADGRHMTTKSIDSIAGGRVWTGEQALKIGLVDKLGGLYAALNSAARMAKIDAYQIYVPVMKDKKQSLSISIEAQKIAEQTLENNFGSLYQLYLQTSDILNNDKIQARCFVTIE